MTMYSVKVLQLAIIAINLWSVTCFSKDEESAAMAILQPVMMGCVEECEITEDDMKKPNIEDMKPCFKKCLLTGLGLLNSDGEYESGAVIENLSAFIKDEDKIKKFSSALDDCFKSKEDEIKGAEDAVTKRADILLNCIKIFPKPA